MKITPKYVIVNKDGYVKCGKKDINSAREYVKGTNNKIFNLETKKYENEYIS
jgi:hypothetical protein